MGVAGTLWGTAARRERDATCAGRWGREAGNGNRETVAAAVRLIDPVSSQGGVVDAEALPGSCGGPLRLRWPGEHVARGGTQWVVAGRWSGVADRGVLVVRRLIQLEATPRGRGAVRDALAARSAGLFGARAPIVNALVFAPNASLDPDIRERYVRSGLAHLLSISGLHVGFLAAWLALLLRKLHLAPGPRFAAMVLLLAGYLWLLGLPPPAVRAGAMLVLAEIAGLRQRVVLVRGTGALGRGRAGRLVAVEVTTPPVADRRARRIRDHDSRRDVSARRRWARRLSLLDGTFSRCGAGGCGGAAHPQRTLDRDRRGPPHAGVRRRPTYRGPVLAAPGRQPGR